ncbi:MAG: hypothetical protein LBR22_03600 [Desulfovibrio sp.]|nr:hypothetical protein [Desulfovibrio sp.]
MKILSLLALVAFLLFPSGSIAYDSSDIDRLTTLAAIYGRATACGENVEAPIAKTETWINTTFGDEKDFYKRIFMMGMYQSAKNQSQGKTPEDCEAVLRIFRSMNF